jgi:hypothetical protein
MSQTQCERSAIAALSQRYRSVIAARTQRELGTKAARTWRYGSRKQERSVAEALLKRERSVDTSRTHRHERSSTQYERRFLIILCFLFAFYSLSILCLPAYCSLSFRCLLAFYSLSDHQSLRQPINQLTHIQVPGCSCHACKNHSRAYIHHLLKSRELLAEILLYSHNQHTVRLLFKGIRQSIADGNFQEKFGKYL